MKQIRTFFLVLFCIFSVFTVFAQKTDSISQKRIGFVEQQGRNKYNPERGFFQKVHTDRGEPHFMIEDSKTGFRFGVGGTIHFTGFYDFSGAVNDNTFSTWYIPVTTPKNGQFGLSMGSSKINLKAVGKVGKQDLLAFFEFGVGANDNFFKIRNIYMSYAGLTIGHTYSIFMDLAAGPMTVDLEGPNTQISLKHPLIAYTLPIGKHWTIAASVERPELGTVEDDALGLSPETQKVPDFAAHVKFQTDKGHIQLAGLFRTLYFYQQNINQTDPGVQHRFGYGLALSGTAHITKKLSFSAQAVGGVGISQYVQDLSFSQMNLQRVKDPQGHITMVPPPIIGGYASLEYDWSPHFVSSIIYGHTHLFYYQGYDYLEGDIQDFNYSDYAAANFFWNVNDDFTMGIEYLFGHRCNLSDQWRHYHGYAHRVDLMVMYNF